MKNLVVQKFGGSSLKNADCIQKVAKKIVAKKELGFSVLVVVSAMGDTTDSLLALANQISDSPSSRELDVLLSSGEQVSISLLAMAVESLGKRAVSLTGVQCGIMTDAHHKKARISSIHIDRLEKILNDDAIVIVAGFQGVSEFGDITTLGRGGSDTTAVALSAALCADICEIYTDVDGVFSADPRKVANAQKILEIDYDEMLEMANLGARVLHPRSVELARKFSVPLVVRSSFSSCEGTRITEVCSMETCQVRGVTSDKNITRLSVVRVPDVPGIAFKLFQKLSQSQIHIDMIIQSVSREAHNDISFTVSSEDAKRAATIATEFSQDIKGGEVIIKTDVSKISIVGTGITRNAYTSSKLFETLYKKGINIEMISTSEIKISCLIDSASSDGALQAVHDAFQLEKSL